FFFFFFFFFFFENKNREQSPSSAYLRVLLENKNNKVRKYLGTLCNVSAPWHEQWTCMEELQSSVNVMTIASDSGIKKDDLCEFTQSLCVRLRNNVLGVDAVSQLLQKIVDLLCQENCPKVLLHSAVYVLEQVCTHYPATMFASPTCHHLLMQLFNHPKTYAHTITVRSTQDPVKVSPPTTKSELIDVSFVALKIFVNCSKLRSVLVAKEFCFVMFSPIWQNFFFFFLCVCFSDLLFLF
ncbi:hypothetical protein RFI_16222, partial [Reticulomyxa filosa]